MVAPIFNAWMEPFHDLGMTTLTIRNTGGTDHLSFDAVGLPGFQFIQDPMDYDTRTHHSNMDVYERIQEPDMKQMAVIVASFVYLTANRDEMLPRKPLPKPRARPQFPMMPANNTRVLRVPSSCRGRPRAALVCINAAPLFRPMSLRLTRQDLCLRPSSDTSEG